MLIPTLMYLSAVRRDDAANFSYLVGSESDVPRQGDPRIQPKLGCVFSARDMHVRWLMPFVTEKEESIALFAMDCRHLPTPDRSLGFRLGRLRCGSRSGHGRRRDAECLAHFGFELRHDVLVVFEELTRVLTP